MEIDDGDTKTVQTILKNSYAFTIHIYVLFGCDFRHEYIYLVISVGKFFLKFYKVLGFAEKFWVFLLRELFPICAVCMSIFALRLLAFCCTISILANKCSNLN